VVSAVLIVLVVRTRAAFWKSRPSRYLLAATCPSAAATLSFPWTPLGPLFGFQPLPPSFLVGLASIVALYFAGAEAAKRLFYRWARL
jgi:Mg2+-importing ATPase